MELLIGKSEKQLIYFKLQDVYSEEVVEKVLEIDEKVFCYNVLLIYEQWLDYFDGCKVCFEICKVFYYDCVGKCCGLMGFGCDIIECKCYQDVFECVSWDKIIFIFIISYELCILLNGIVGLS